MQAIVFANRHGQELFPLTARTSVALLPIAAKPVLEHTLELLIKTEIRDIFIILSAHAEQIESRLAQGDQWCTQLHYILTPEQEKIAKTIKRLGAALTHEPTLILRGDILYDVELKPFIQTSLLEENQALIHATRTQQLTGIALWRPTLPLSEEQWTALDWDNLKNQAIIDATHKHIPLSTTTHLHWLQNFQDYYQANMQLLAGRYPTLLIAGWERSAGVYLGASSYVPCTTNGQLITGAFCRVHRKTQLVGQVILADHVVLDGETYIQDSIILSDTYIGKHLDLNCAIVWGNMLIRVDLNCIVTKVDSFLLANMRRDTFGSGLIDFINRTFGLFILILSLPLWLVALICAWRNNPQQPWRILSLCGNYSAPDSDGIFYPVEFKVLEWSVRSPILRALPYLIPIIQGHLRCVGVVPLSREVLQQRQASYEYVRDFAPAGLWGPVQLCADARVTPEEKWLMEAVYARTRNVMIDIVWFARACLTLFRRRVWRGI